MVIWLKQQKGLNMPLKAKDAPDLARFNWEDPFRLNDQLNEE